ncbi:MAG: hypothetical protein NTU57_04745 [Candidatus Aenigmarchaeota archaeon]|nr:hypothetical protein [Candidatus Aenigmarchaeota archaeon]
MINGEYRSPNAEPFLYKAVRTAIGQEIFNRVASGDYNLIQNLEMNTSARITNQNFLEFDFSLNPGKSFDALEIVGKTPQKIRKLYTEESIRSDRILDIEDAIEVHLSTKGMKFYMNKLKNLQRTIFISPDEIAGLISSGKINLNAFQNPEQAGKELRMMTMIVPDKIQYLDTEGIVYHTLKNPEWMRNASEYSRWFFNAIGRRVEEESQQNQPLKDAVNRLMEDYAPLFT